MANRRVVLPGLLHHLCDHEAEGRALFGCEADHLEHDRILADAKARFGIKLLAKCSMTTHVHLVVLDVEGALSSFAQEHKSRYARACNAARSQQGGLYRRRFWSKPIADDAQLRNTVMYVALNPVRAGMVERAEDHRWSSHRSLAHGLSDPLLDVDELVPSFGGTLAAVRANLVTAVAEAARGLGPPAPRGLPRRVLDTARPTLAAIAAEHPPPVAAAVARWHGYGVTEIARVLGRNRRTVLAWAAKAELE